MTLLMDWRVCNSKVRIKIDQRVYEHSKNSEELEWRNKRLKAFFTAFQILLQMENHDIERLNK